MHNADFVLAYESDLCTSASFWKFWNYAKMMYTSLIDLVKAHGRFPRDKVESSAEADVRDQLLAAIKFLNKQSEFCIGVNGMKKSFLVSVLDYNRAVFFLLSCSLYAWKRQTKTVAPVVASHLGSVLFDA